MPDPRTGIGRFCCFAIYTALVSVACVQPVRTAAETVTMVQDAEYPPYMMATEEGAAGVYADIIHEADRRLTDFEIDLKAVPWSRALYLVRSGQVNGIVGAYRRPEERPWVRRYSVAMMQENVFVFCREGVAGRDWSYPEDYAGLTFGNNRGFETPGPAFFNLVKDGRIFLSEEDNTELSLRVLHFGRTDCYVQEKIVVDPILREHAYDNIIPVKQIASEPVYVGYSDQWRSETSDRFIARLNRVFLEMRQDGTIDRILTGVLLK